MKSVANQVIHQCRLVGIQYVVGAQTALNTIPAGTAMRLVRNPENEYDRNAVQVWTFGTRTHNGLMLGHIDRDTARFVAKAMDRGWTVRSVYLGFNRLRVSWTPGE